MNTYAELVKSVLRWALTIMLAEDSRHGSIPGPRISQFMLGNMMCRTDTATALAIAREIAEIERLRPTDACLEGLIACIRASWGNTSTTPVRRTGLEGLVDHANTMVVALRRFSTEHDRDLLEIGSLAKSWKSIETVYPGRVWTSIRDDYTKLAVSFYHKESLTVCSTAEFITEVAKRGGLVKERRTRKNSNFGAIY